MSRLTRRVALATGAMAMLAQAASAQDYPNRPIRFLVGFAAGGSSDIVARVIGQKMSDILGTPIPVENRTGANGTIAMRVAAQAAPDGYTMTIAGATVMAISPHTTANLGYDPVKDFVGVATVSKSPIVIAVNPSVPAKTLKELVDVAKGGDLTMGSSGVGGIAHLTIEMFNAAARRESDPCALHRRRACRDRRRCRPHQVARDGPCAAARLHRRRQDARDRGSGGKSLRDAAGYADRDRAGFPGHECRQLVRDRRTGRHAAADRRQAARCCA